MSAASDYAPLAILLVVVVFIFIRRIIASVHGTRLTVARLAIYAGVVAAIFALTVATGYGALPWYSFPADVAVVLASAFLGANHVASRVEVYEDPPGQWRYRLGPLIPIVYLLLFVTRLLLDFLVLVYNPLSFSAIPGSLSPATQAVFVVVDLLFAVSTGLVVGRTIGVYRRFERKLRENVGGVPLR